MNIGQVEKLKNEHNIVYFGELVVLNLQKSSVVYEH
jgi:hypothetical protein